MSAPIIDEAAKVFADPTSYADEPQLHAALTHLRAHAPVSLVDSRTPVKEFMRTATADTSIRGVPIAQGESVYLSYVSGNRDEEVFDDPSRFDVGRDPNKHLAFGYGVHFCLGAQSWPGWK
jgi:cytochrome P450